LYTSILSILLFFINKTGLLSTDLIAKSVTYTFIAPFGPAILDALGTILPWFKNMFTDLNGFFEELAKKATPAVEAKDLQ
jgi:membrane protein required for colicin V production